MDSGEGRYFNETFGNQQDSVGFYLRKDRIVSGSRVVYDPSTRFEGRGLVDSKTIYHYNCKLLNYYIQCFGLVCFTQKSAPFYPYA